MTCKRALLGTTALVPLLLAAAPARAVLLSEVLYDAVGTDNATVFVELWGAPGTLLDGWRIEGVNGADGAVGPSLALSGAIPADGFFVIADSDAGTTQVAEADLLANFDFQNGPDSVVLRDALGNVLDALGYGEFAPTDVFAGEGRPAPDGAAGQSLARLVANLDTDDNLADWALLDLPTPGHGPVVPEPTSAAALLLSAAALIAARNFRSPSAA